MKKIHTNTYFKIIALFCLILSRNLSQFCYAQVTTKNIAISTVKAQTKTENRISIENKNYQQGGIFEGKTPQEEILNLRTEFTKKFNRTDGKIDIIFGGPFHYKEANNSWKDIDLRIMPQTSNSTYQYTCNANRFKSNFATTTQDGAEVNYKNIPLKFGINPTISSISWLPTNGSTSILTNENTITYSNIYKDANLKYAVTTEKIAHELQVQSASFFNGVTQPDVDFSEEINLPINAIIKDKNGIVNSSRQIEGNLFIVVNNDTIYTILQPRIWDANFVDEPNNNEEYYKGNSSIFFPTNFVTFSNSTKIIITSKVLTSWLKSATIKYPIVFDPTVSVSVGNQSSFSNGYRYPFNTCRTQRLSQILFLQSEINMSGDISDISFLQDALNPIANNNVYIKSKETTINTNTNSVIATGLSTYYSSGTINSNIGNIGWRAISLSTPISYSNIKNLLIEVGFSNSSKTGGCTCLNHSPGGKWSYWNDNSAPAGTGRHLWAYSNNSSAPPSGTDCAGTGLEDNPGFGNQVPATKFTIGSASSSCSGWQVIPASVQVPASHSIGNTFQVAWTGGCGAIAQSNNTWINNLSSPSAGVLAFDVDQNNTGGILNGSISIYESATNSLVATFYVSQAAGCSAQITSQPTDAPVNLNIINSASFSVSATGNNLQYEWEYSTNGVSYFSTSGNSHYQNYNTATLSISNVDFSMDSYYYRCKISYICPSTGLQTLITYSGLLLIYDPSAAVADFTVSKHNINGGETVTFTNNSRNNYSNSWTFNGGIPSTSSSSTTQSVQYNTPGTYRVSLTVCNNLPASTPLHCRTKIQLAYIVVRPSTGHLANKKKKNAINGNQYHIADPIQVGTATYKYSHTDLKLPDINNTLNFTRFYNTVNNTENSQLGYGWSHTYNYFLDIQLDPTSLKDTLWSLHYPDGHIQDYIPFYYDNLTYPRESFALYTGSTDSMAMINASDIVLYSKDNHQYHFNASGQLILVTDLNNNTTTINYNGNNISSIFGQNGRGISLNYSGNYISSITESINIGYRFYNYVYDFNGNLISATDFKSGTTQYTYDANHRMTSVINNLTDIIVSNTYDAQGRVIKQRDANNQLTTLDYDIPSIGYTTITNPDTSQVVVFHDEFYRNTYIKDELGFTNTFTYDDNSNIVSFTNENNINESSQYDWKGNVTNKIINSNILSQFAYNNYNSLTQIIDPNNNSTYYAYDGRNNLIDIHLADNTYQHFYYNANGTKNKFIDGRNNAITYGYYVTGQLAVINAPNGQKNYGYDASGRLVTVTDENNYTTQILYDKNDNITSIIDPLLHSTIFNYDANNQLLSIKDKKGFITTFTYDKKGRLKTKINSKGGVTSYTYNLRDKLISVTDPNNHTIYFAYDKKGRKTSTTNALSTTQYFYDGLGNVTKVIDGTGKPTYYNYTATNKVQSSKDNLNDSTIFIYDKNDNLVSTINALNKTTAYTYDAMNRLVSVLDASNKTTSITYDENGNKKTITDPKGNTQQYSYDPTNRLISFIDATNNTISYGYDPAGNNLSITKPTGTISKAYDQMNRLQTVVVSSGDNFNFQYDDNNNIISMSSNNTGITSMLYDSLNQLIKYTNPFNKTVSFAYDPAGNKSSITYPNNNKVSYTYDAVNNLKTVTDWLSHTFTYTYDATGKNTQLLYPNGIHCDYGFDNANRLTSKKNTTATNTIINGSQFGLDAIGNRTSEQRQGLTPSSLLPSTNTYNYGNDDRMLSNSNWNYTNDNAGNRISETNGAVTANYTFTSDNLLSSFTDTTGITTSYTYDPLGRRLSKTNTSNSIQYVLDISSGLSQILQTTDAGGVVKSQYVYGLGLLERIDSANNSLYYQFDAQHNTVALTDVNGLTKDTYLYDPFGVLLAHNGTTNQPFTFLGEYGVEQENMTLYYIRARYYDAANGRFLSKDFYPFDLNNSQTINRYVYSTNNPINLVDYTGLWPNLGTLWQGVQDIGSTALNLGIGIGQATLSGVQIAVGDVADGMSSFYSSLNYINTASYYSVGAVGNIINGVIGNNPIPQSWYSGVFDNFYQTDLAHNLNTIQEIYNVFSVFHNIFDIAKGNYSLFSSKVIDKFGSSNLSLLFGNIPALVSADIKQLYDTFYKDPVSAYEFFKTHIDKIFLNHSNTNSNACQK